MKKAISFILFLNILILMSCKSDKKNTDGNADNYNYVLEQFADIRILRYQVPGFDELSLKQKELIYYLSQAALCGRDILFDQNGKYNLVIRRILETIYLNNTGDKNSQDWKNLEIYLKRIWFSNGIYHHYSSDKILPGFSKEYFLSLIQSTDTKKLPLLPGKSWEQTIDIILPVIFDPSVLPKKVSQETDKDLIAQSAINFYQNGISQDEVEKFYSKLRIPEDTTPVSYGLNSKLVSENGNILEKVWKSGSMYGQSIDQIIVWLEKAGKVAESPTQKKEIELLISYYKTGNLKTWDDYNVTWVDNQQVFIDFVNGFIEVYSDPLGMKASWESIVNFKDLEATRRTQIISENAQWFEDNSPVDPKFKKKEVKGVSAKVITIAMLGGDCYPATPIGINLPNADWIRKDHGSKSVTLENITYAYARANLTSGFLEEFSLTKEDMDLERKYGPMADNLHTDLHECLGHGSGQLLPGITSEMLKSYHSALEETRADLFALYYMLDPKMVELGILPSLDAAKVHYLSYIRNGLMTQLRRIEPGKNIEQAHMRNRQLIASWCYEKGKSENVIEKVIKNGKTFFRINKYEKLRELFGKLLIEVQRIKSEGDYEAGKQLVETYGVKVDQKLQKEVISRFEELNLAPYSGFVNPEYEVVLKGDSISDIKIKYTENYPEQMLNYSRDYSFLPNEN